MKKLIVLTMFLALPMVVFASSPAKGDKEVAARVSHSDVDFGSVGGNQLGGTTITEIQFTLGWFLTDSHEVGFSVSYIRQELDGGDFFVGTDVDGTSSGGFYHYNFQTSGNITPYLGVNAGTIGGDTGDVYDLQYGAEGGFKLYPFEHGGVAFGVGYSTLQSDIDSAPDATGLTLGAALLLKF